MKRLVLLSLLLFPIFLFAQYPTFSNKQRLGVQTTGDGLIFRGTTVNNIPTYTPSNINNAYFHLDTIANKLYLYNGGWQQVYPAPQFDTTTLNVYLKISDTTAMLLPYFRDSDTTQLNLINRFALKLNISDTSVMLSPYLRKADTISLSNRINLKFNTSDTTILSNRITTNANNIITINTKLDTKLDTIYVKFKDVVTRVLNKDTINIGSSLIDGYAINIIGDSINIDTTVLDIRYPDRDSTNELQDITFGTTSGVIVIPGSKVINLDTLYNSVIDSVKNLIQDSIAAFIPVTEGYGINIIGDSINVDTTIIFTQSDTITLSNRIDLKLNTSDTISLSNRINTKLNITDTISLSNRIDTKLNISDTTNMLIPYFKDTDTSLLNLTSRLSLKLNASDTASLSNRIDLKLNKSDTVSLSNRINTKLDTIYAQYPTYLDTITNKETITIPKDLTEGFGINIIANSINIDSAVILNTQQKQIAYVKNQSGVTMYKGQAVYSSGSTGDNKLVLLASSSTEQTSSKTFGVVESDSILNGTHGYIITFGLLSGFNTNGLTEGSSVYLSSTPGQLTTTKPQAPLHLVTIGVCIRQQQNNGSIFVKIQNGFELDELHDVRITSPVNNASLYYSGGLWRDTTSTLLVSDTASMLNPYLRKLDTILLSNRIDLRVKYADTTSMLLPYFRTNDTTLLNLNSRLSIKLNLSDTANMLSKYVNTYSNQIDINGDKTFNNVITIDSATVTGKLLVNTNINDAVKINSNTNSTNLELMNSGGSVYIKSSNKNMTLQTDTTALVYLKGDVNRVGILTMNPEQALEVAGTIRVDSLDNNLTPVKLVGSNSTNDLTDVKLGTGLSISNDTLKIADDIINSGDTATLLRQDFLSINTNVLVWTQGNKKLLPYFTQVYRNGQLLKSDSQYTITNDSIVTLEEGSYRLNDNITIIAIDNIVALAGGGGIITLQGDVTGSGTNTITTTIGTGKVTNTMLAGSISNNKLDVITTAGKVSNSATTATNNNTNNAIVSRDGSGNFIASTITANLSGNANTATTLATGRTLSITGDLTYTSPSFNGSTNVTAVGTLANSGVTANTYTAATITVDAKGRVTSASNNTIPTVNNGTLTLAVSGSGLTGSQSFTANQSSAATFTVTSNATNANTPSTIVFRDASGNFSANIITAANGFLGNATSSTNATFAANVTNYLVSTESFRFRSNNNNTGQRIITFPDGDITVARTDAAQTFTGTQTFSSTISGNINGNAATATNVAYSGLTGTVPTWNQNTTGTAATITGVYSGTITSSQITTGLGFTPYNATNPSSYITSSALSPYATLASPTFTGTVSGITKTMVGLSNVDNTSDVSKPVSTATKDSLNLRLNKSDTLNMLVPYLRDADTTNMLLPYLRDVDTTLLNLTSRFATKQNNITLTTTGTSGVATFNGTTLNVPNYTVSGLGGLSNSTTSTQDGYFGNILLYDDNTPSHYLTITNSANLTAARTLSINTNDVDRTISLSGNLTVSNTATISGTNTGDQTITLTGDVTGSGSGSFATTLANSGVTASTYRSVTVDSKGRVTAGTNPTTLAGYGITNAVDTGRTITINGTALNLSANRSYNVGTITSVTGTVPIVSSGGTTPVISINPATISVAGSMSAADKTKLDGIAAGAQVNVATNLAQGTRTTTSVPITSSTGTSATLDIATTTLAGVMSSADKTKLNGIATGATANTGTVTSVSSLTLGTNGNDLSSSVATGTTTPIITLNVPNASASNRGVLTSNDWTTFNNKLNLTGGTLTGALNVNGTSTLNFTNVYGKNTYVPFNVGLGEQSIFNIGAYLRGGTVMIFPDSSLAGSSGNLFFANSNVLGVEYSARGSGIRNYIKQGGDVNRNSLALYTSDIGQQNTNRLYINYNGDIGINDDTPSYKLDVNGTFNATGNSLIGGTLGVIGNISFGSKSVYSGQYTRYLQSSETSPYRDLFIGSLGTDGAWAGRIHFQTSYATETPTTAMTINHLGNINMNGTLGVSGQTTLSNLGSVGTGVVVTSNTGLLSTATTVNQTGLMTTGNWSTNTGTSVATFDVTHNLGVEPSSVIITPQTINGGATKIFYEVIGKTSSIFRVQAFNLTTGSPATSTAVSIYWIAIK